MSRRSIVPIDKSAEFRVDELFFSTTDLKGRITSCNDVFLRIAGYPSEEMLGAAHSIIRHPDMPRSVFRLLWDYLQAGKSIGAYVKNLALSGEYYWVYALVTPIPGGYVSCRLKPTSERLALVEGLYREMLEIEAEHGSDKEAAIAAGTAHLIGALRSLGLTGYDQFLVQSLRVEMAARNAAVGSLTKLSNEAERTRSIFDELRLVDTLESEASQHTHYFEEIGLTTHRIALNSAICAAKLPEGGGGLGVLSDQVAMLAETIAQQAGELDEASHELTPIFETMTFEVAMASLVAETATYFRKLHSECTLDEDAQRAMYGDTLDRLAQMLDGALQTSLHRVAEGIVSVRSSLWRFDEIIERFRKVLMTTRVSYVTGRTLAASTVGGEQYTTLLNEMAFTSDRGRDRLVALQEATQALSSAMIYWDQSA